MLTYLRNILFVEFCSRYPLILTHLEIPLLSNLLEESFDVD